MPLAAAAYSNNPQQCLSNIQYSQYGHQPYYNVGLYRQYSIKCDSLNDTCSGFTAVDCASNEIIISFKGVTNPKQFYQSWNYTEMIPFVIGGKVNKQIFDAFNDIWIKSGMRDDVYTLRNKLSDLYRFTVVGHSTGGAMASLAAATMVSIGITTQDNLFLTTYGQPRTGDKDFANAFTNAFDYQYIRLTRVIHNHDIVPHLPSLNSSGYYHHVTENWYPNDMGSNVTFYICDSYDGEDPQCCDSLLNSTLNFDDHNIYFGREFSDYGIKGCPDLGTAGQKSFKNTSFTKNIPNLYKSQNNANNAKKRNTRFAKRNGILFAKTPICPDSGF
uniref:Fungal lipase-like domain-containing protein n=1 Tax=Panagrolaimus sp. PS1159 TaxID=55785 RepID=A0AC35EYK9_9BILA